jgi:hypothetical protein
MAATRKRNREIAHFSQCFRNESKKKPIVTPSRERSSVRDYSALATPTVADTAAPDALARATTTFIPGEDGEKKPPSDAKLGASFALPFADCHSSYSENVRMSTVGCKIFVSKEDKAFPDKTYASPPIGVAWRPFRRRLGRPVATPEI